MSDMATARKIALTFPDVVEMDHQGRPSFRVNKRIFVTLHPDSNRIVLKFSIDDQMVFCEMDNSSFYPVPGSWGAQGWTFAELGKLNKEVLQMALETAWRTVAPSDISGSLSEGQMR